jgi:DNA-binding MarR family transcriptional regulator
MEQISQILKDISRSGRLYREEKLAPLGLTSRHGLYLREIGMTPGISQEQLAQKLSVNKSNVARQVAAMEEEGYIQRAACGKDKRVLRLQLTPKGQALLPGIQQVMENWEGLLVESLTESEQQILEILLLRLRGNARQALEEVGE